MAARPPTSEDAWHVLNCLQPPDQAEMCLGHVIPGVRGITIVIDIIRKRRMRIAH
jgi:hypothetical protein